MIPFQKKVLFKVTFTAILLALSGVCVYFFTKKINQVIKQTDLLKQELEKRSSLVSQIQKLEQEKLEASPYFTALQQYLPTESEAIKFEEKLQELATENHLDLSFRFGALNTKEDQDSKNYSFDFILSGKQKDILQWFQNVENLPYAFSFEKIEFIEQSFGGGAYTVKVLGRIYLR